MDHPNQIMDFVLICSGEIKQNHRQELECFLNVRVSRQQKEKTQECKANIKCTDVIVVLT